MFNILNRQGWYRHHLRSKEGSPLHTLWFLAWQKGQWEPLWSTPDTNTQHHPSYSSHPRRAFPDLCQVIQTLFLNLLEDHLIFGPYSNDVKQSKSPLYPDYDGAPVHCACLITSNLIARTPKISTRRLGLESTEGIKNAQCCPLLGSISWKMIMYVHCTSRRDQTNGNKLWVPLMILFGFLMAEVSAGADWCPSMLLRLQPWQFFSKLLKPAHFNGFSWRCPMLTLLKAKRTWGLSSAYQSNVTSSYTNLDKITSSESRPSIKRQHQQKSLNKNLLTLWPPLSRHLHTPGSH